MSSVIQSFVMRKKLYVHSAIIIKSLSPHVIGRAGHTQHLLRQSDTVFRPTISLLLHHCSNSILIRNANIFRNVSLSRCRIVALSRCRIVALSHCGVVALSRSHNVKFSLGLTIENVDEKK